jgi:hypothetical protein
VGPTTVVRLLKGPALRNSWACFKGVLQRKMDNYRYFLIPIIHSGKKKHDIIQKEQKKLLFAQLVGPSNWVK